MADLKVLFAQQTGALDAFKAAPDGAIRVLMYPIAHHRWMAEYLAVEARENPSWAPFLQGHDRSAADMRRLDEEIHLADRVIVPSAFVRETFVLQGVPLNRLIVLPLGADTQDITGGDGLRVPRRRARAGALNLLFVGQLTQRKGLSYLLDAFLAADIPGATLTLVGPATAAIRAMIPDDDRIIVMGSQPRAHLQSFYSAADVLVLPSLAEGFPLSAIEAMACGTACVVSEHTFADDVVREGENGWIVPARNSDALASLFHKLNRDPALIVDAGAQAKATAETFTWAKYRDGAPALLASLEATRIKRE